MIHTYPPKEGENDTYLSSEGGRVWYIPICEMRVGMEIPYLTQRVGISIPAPRPYGLGLGMEIPILVVR